MGTGLALLLDHFQLENGDFATVWEYCEGDTLEAYLLRNGPMQEKEMRGFALQILGVLKVLESKGHRTDERDLKASRLILRGGELRLTSVRFASLGANTESR